MKNFWTNQKVLVTGAAGFIGSHAVDALVDQGAKVTAQISTRKNQTKARSNLSSSIKKIKLVKADLLDLATCVKITKNQNIIFNFAALDGGSEFKKKHSAEIFKVNSQIVLNLLEASLINKVDRFLLISSIEVYPDKVKQPIAERSGFMKGLNEKIDGYAWAKRFSEIAAKMYSTQYGLSIAIARLGNIYGPRDHMNKGRVIPTFINQAKQNKPITVWNAGSLKKSFLHVRDLSQALMDLVEKHPRADPLNIASENYISIMSLAQKIIKATESKSKIVNIKSEIVMGEKIINVNKSKKIINFKEGIDIDLGLAQTIEYMNDSKS